MAEFCKDCSIVLFGHDTKDLAGIARPGHLAMVLCEGCGFIIVDEDGKRVEPEDISNSE